MAKGASRILTFVLGAAAIVALAGGGAYFFLDRDSREPVKIVELVNKPDNLAQTTDVLDRPTAEGRFLIRIRQGASVTVLGVVDGAAWLQIALPKDQDGYIPSASIPEIASDGTPKPAAPAATPPAATPPAAVPLAAAPPAAVPPATVPPAAASTPSPVAADDGPESPPPSDLVDFQSVDEQLSVVQPTGLYLAPNEHAPQALVVKPETKVEIIAVSKDGKWGWVNVSDGTPAYIKLADLSSPPPPANPQ